MIGIHSKLHDNLSGTSRKLLLLLPPKTNQEPLLFPSPGCSPTDTPGHSFPSSKGLLYPKPLAGLESGEIYDFFANPSAAAVLLAVDKRKSSQMASQMGFFLMSNQCRSSATTSFT